MKLRRVFKFVTCALEFPILLAICCGINIVTSDRSWETQKSSLFVFFPVLMLNLMSFIGNLYDVLEGLW